VKGIHRDDRVRVLEGLSFLEFAEEVVDGAMFRRDCSGEDF
jgi:hypothetical protein